MNEKEFRDRYDQEKDMYLAWGRFVQDYIVTALSEQCDTEAFLKISPQTPRLKSMDSLLAKAFHRDKNYASPYDDITDKVGIRFVVLLTRDTGTLCRIVESQEGLLWRASKDKDYEAERLQSPEHFTYESVHYVVYNLTERTFEGIIIPPGIPCEVQIRTLLQHAYAEMSHDTIYKPKVKVNPMVKRYLSRSMALVESADHFFLSAISEIDTESQKYLTWADLCATFYPFQPSSELDANANTLLIDSLLSFLDDVSSDDVETYLQNNKVAFDTLIKDKTELSWIYRQPAVLLVYYLIDHKNTTLQTHWPLISDLLDMLLSDRGVSPLSYLHA